MGKTCASADATTEEFVKSSPLAFGKENGQLRFRNVAVTGFQSENEWSIVHSTCSVKPALTPERSVYCVLCSQDVATVNIVAQSNAEGATIESEDGQSGKQRLSIPTRLG